MKSLKATCFDMIGWTYFEELTPIEELFLMIWAAGSTENTILLAEYGNPDWVPTFVKQMEPPPKKEVLARIWEIIEKKKNTPPFDVEKNMLKVLGPEPE